MTTFDPAGGSDAPVLLELMEVFYAEEGYPFDRERARQALLPLLEDECKGRVWILREDGEVVGYVVLTLGWSLEYHGRDAFVDELFVLPSHRGHGLGRRALEVVAAACREVGVRALHLEVERDNEGARALYRKWGFADHDRLLLTRRLAGDE